MASLDAERKAVRRSRVQLSLALVGALGLAVVGTRARATFRDIGTLSPEPSRASQRATPLTSAAQRAELEGFVSALVKDQDAIWTADFRRRATPYVAARPVLVNSPAKADCGPGLTLLGRPDCLGRNEVFIDLSFLRDLETRSEGDASSAKAYVIAHEMGHHVQRVLGLDKKLDELLAEKPVGSHWAAVQIELQADCLAGVWSRRSQQRHLLEPAQIESSIRRASELGAERRLEKSARESVGESFTYAVPRRRIYWFAQGFAKGDVDDCDTFAP